MSANKLLQRQNTKLLLRLMAKEFLTHDTNRYTFGFPSHNDILGLPVGGCIYLHTRIRGEDVRRPYTPSTLDDFIGNIKIVVKTYRKDVNPKFPAGGKMS
ncbi:hypothetical protein ACTXT7_017520, partial [Hymenolepis weldensis]